MPENDFEKQVQQKMDELQFVPSDAVWPEVERQIEKRKKRRGLVFWLPFGALLLGGASWMYFSGADETANKKQSADSAIANTLANNKNKIDNIPAADNDATHKITQAAILKDSASVHTSEKSMVDAGAKTIDKNDVVLVKKSRHDKDQKNNASILSTKKLVSGDKHEKVTVAVIKSASNKYKSIGKIYSANAIAKKTSNKTTPVVEDETAEDAAAVKSSATTEKDNAVVQSSQDKIKAIPVDPVTDSIISRDPIVAKDTNNDSLQHANELDSSKAITKTKIATKTKKKIEWGININGGVSSVSDGVSGLFSSSRSYGASAFLSNQQPSPGNLNGGSISAAKPSALKPGFSYAAGMFVNIPLNKKINLVTGVNYAYYSNKLHAGAKFDSAGTIYYSLGDFNSYTNRFHFIEIPITFQLHTARFAVNGGLSFSMLTGTNAILYNAQGKYYYKDNSLVNKMQAGLLAGFSYRLFPKTMPIEIGPQLNYNLSSIFNKDLYGSRHLLFTGINAKFFLHKK